MAPSEGKLERFDDGIRELWENQTLARFMKHPQWRDGQQYDFGGFRERPDRVLTPAEGGGQPIGVEVTWAVRPDDARDRIAEYRLGKRIVETLESWAPGGIVHLMRGEVPVLERAGIADFGAELERVVSSAGGLQALQRAGGLTWRHLGSHWLLEARSDHETWEMWNNTGQVHQRWTKAPAQIAELILERIRSKRQKAQTYEWVGPLYLLVRNPYQVFVPDAANGALFRAELSGSPFRQVWLVNAKESVYELAPPPETLVRLD